MIVQMSVSWNNFIYVLFPFYSSATDTTDVLLDANRQHWCMDHWHQHFTELKLTCSVVEIFPTTHVERFSTNATRLHHWSTSWCQNSQLQQKIDGIISEIITSKNKTDTLFLLLLLPHSSEISVCSKSWVCIGCLSTAYMYGLKWQWLHKKSTKRYG